MRQCLGQEAQVMAECRGSSVETMTSRLLEFGEFRLDPSTGQLWRNDKEIKLPPRAAALLSALAGRSLQVVSKQELIDRVWHGKAVGDDALTSCVQEVRRALGDDWRRPRFLETRHRRGYRLLVPARPAAMNSSAMESSTSSSLAGKPSLAVLPFDNLSPDQDQDYFADGVVEDITTALTRIGAFFVIARNSSFAFKGRAVPVQEVGRQLGVRYIVEGSVRRAGHKLRLTAQLIEAESGRHLWAEHYERPSGGRLRPAGSHSCQHCRCYQPKCLRCRDRTRPPQASGKPAGVRLRASRPAGLPIDSGSRARRSHRTVPQGT